ncbi:MAG: cardiolipin synthase [Tissierellia bacterium]|nr:cardiolipin synthase [Tissierellia bacterium]
MKNLIKLLFNKVTIIAVLIALQAFYFVMFFIKLKDYANWITPALTLLSIAMFLAIIMSYQNPAYKIVWIVIIGIVPLMGGLLYLLLGNKRPSKKLEQKILKQEDKYLPLLKQKNDIKHKMPKRLASISKYIEDQGYPAHENTQIEYFKIGEEMYENMLRDLRNAKHFIFFEYFIIKDGKMWQEIKEILIQKAKEGLDIRVMFDDMGCIGVLPKNFVKDLEASGIKVAVFNPLVPFLSLVMNNRDHRKILVIDGYIGYNGGINIADEYINLKSPYGHWKDTGVRLFGEAVWNLTIMFLNIWGAYYPDDFDYKNYMPNKFYNGEFKSDGFIQPFSDSPLDFEEISENVYMDILWQANDYVYIFTPYLIITNEMNVALEMAAKRGVDVRLVVPGIPDKKSVYQLTKSYFNRLMKAGVKIYLYEPGFIHAKSYISDDEIAIVGTINMDYRSLYLHFECGTLMINSEAIKDLKTDCFEVFKLSKLVTETDIKRGPLSDLTRAVLRVLSPLF